jgi:hypothetical protein
MPHPDRFTPGERPDTQLKNYSLHNGTDSSVGIATGYGLDGLGIESQYGRDFSYLSIPAVGPNQPPVKWIPGLSRG